MLNFEKYSEDALKKYSNIISDCPYNVNDISIGSFYMWNKGVNLMFCEAEGSFISSQEILGEPAFSYPYGGNEEKAETQILEYVNKNNFPLKFYGVTDEILEKIKNSKNFSNLMFNYERKWSDYIYDIDEICEFKGKKFSGQRNHINKFKKLYGEPDFRTVNREDIPKIREMLIGYAKEHPDKGYEENEEYLHTLELMNEFLNLGLIGGSIFIDNRPVSFTVGEIQNENFIIHIEKALTKYEGVYPVTFNSFMKYVKEKYPQIKFVNREDDSGDEGLRVSKTRYHPIKMVNKYLVKINSPLYGLEEIPTIISDGLVLSKITENDKKDYRELCTDIDNNRLWGYDYREDPEITGNITDDTFYDILEFDFSIGEGMSLAVREKNVSSVLLGEVIVYNFTYNGFAEVGIRLKKENQGKGIGKKAYKLICNWAEKNLNVKLRAKCFKENKASEMMIISAGFTKTSEDAEFYYFLRV